MTAYNGFRTIDISQVDWWLRGFYIPSVHELGFIVLQDHLDNQFPNTLNVGIVIGEDERDAYDQLFDPTFDRSIGESEVLITLEALMLAGDLPRVMRETTLERGKQYLRIAGEPNTYEFDKTVLSIFNYHGFGEKSTEGNLEVLRMEAHERNSH